MKDILKEELLSKQEVDDLTKRWFDIKNAPKNDMSDLDKRKKYDELYDEATDKVFKDIKTVKGYIKVKEYMRQAWLKLGFEAGDGANKAMNLTLDLLKRTNTANNPDAVIHIVPFILNNYDYVDDYLDGNDEASNLLKFFVVQRKDLWSKYSEKDIVQILGAIYNKLKEANPKDLNKIIQQFLKTDNLRDFLKGDANKNSSVVKVNKVTQKSSESDVEATLRSSGVLDNKETAALAQKVLSRQ